MPKKPDPKVRVEFSNYVHDDEVAPATIATDWYDRILFHDSCLWGRTLGAGGGDRKLAGMRYDGNYGYVAMVDVASIPCYYARFDVIPKC